MRKRSYSDLFFLLILLVLLSACKPAAPAQSKTYIRQPEKLSPAETADLNKTPDITSTGLSPVQVTTLSSLKRVNDFPVYEMHYQGGYDQNLYSRIDTGWPLLAGIPRWQSHSAWGCSLFAALGGEEMLFGRNFDWNYSPVLFLYTDPPEGFASVSLVDLAYLFTSDQVGDLLSMPLQERTPLLDAPHMPFDGMNEQGLAIGMAAVPLGQVSLDPAKPSLDSLEIMREVLDHARNVDEALDIFQSYNVLMDGGPPLHYLIADRSGRAVLVEFTDRMITIANQDPWHVATNHLRALVEPGAPSGCWRYDRIAEQLASSEGQLTAGEAVDLLEQVSQSGESPTQWSVVYGMSTGEVQLRVGRDYSNVLSFKLEMAGETPAIQPGDLP